MAHSHAQTATGFSATSLWTPSPAVQHGIRFGVATAGAIWLGYAMGFPQPTWPVITVLMIAQPTAGASVQKSMLRLCGTLMAGVVAIAIFGLVGQDHLLLAASTSAAYAFGVYGMTGPRHGYAWNVMGFTTGIILGGAFAGTSNVENLAFDRVTLVAVGVLAGLLAEAIFWPTRPEPSLRASLGQHFAAISKQLDETQAAWRGAPRERNQAESADPTSFLNVLTLLDQLRMQLGVGPKRIRAFGQVSFGLQALDGTLRSLTAAAGTHGDSATPSEADPAGELLDEARRALAGLAEALQSELRTPTHAEALSAALSRFETAYTAQLAALSSDEPTLASSDEVKRAQRSVSKQSLAAPILERMVNLLIAIEGALDVIALDQPETGSPFSQGSGSAARTRFSIDPLRVELALRGGLAVAAVFVVMPLMGWPVSSTPMTLAFMVAAIPTRTALGQTVAGIALATLGAAIVADLSIMYIIPHLGRSPVALLYPFVIAGGAGYVMVAVPKLAPIAPLFATVTILSVFGGSRAPDNVAGPYLTVWTISVGIFIGVIAQRLLWPRTASELLRIRVAQQIGLCLGILRPPEDTETGDDRSRLLTSTLARRWQGIALITQLNAHAHEERAEAGLDDDARAALVSGVEELFDTSLQVDAFDKNRQKSLMETAHPTLRELAIVLDDVESAVLSSLESSMRALEQGTLLPETGLAGTTSAAITQIDTMRGKIQRASAPDVQQLGKWLPLIDGIKRLVSCALALEAWVGAWQEERESKT